MWEHSTLTWAIPNSNTSGQCQRGYSSSDRTDFARPVYASWHNTSNRSRHNHEWIAWPGWNLWRLTASTFVWNNGCKYLDSITQSFLEIVNTDLHTNCLLQCVKINTSGGVEKAYFSSVSFRRWDRIEQNNQEHWKKKHIVWLCIFRCRINCVLNSYILHMRSFEINKNVVYKTLIVSSLVIYRMNKWIITSEETKFISVTKKQTTAIRLCPIVKSASGWV